MSLRASWNSTPPFLSFYINVYLVFSSTDEKKKNSIKPQPEAPAIDVVKSYASVTKLNLDQINKNTDDRNKDTTEQNKLDDIGFVIVTLRRDLDQDTTKHTTDTENKSNKEYRRNSSLITLHEPLEKQNAKSSLRLNTLFASSEIQNAPHNSSIEIKSQNTTSSSLGIRTLFGSLEDNNSNEKQLDGPQEIVMESQAEADYNISEADYASRADMKDMHAMMEDFYKPENQTGQQPEDRLSAYKKLAATSSKTAFVNEIRQKTNQLIRQEFPLKIQAINEMNIKLTEVIVQQTNSSQSSSIFNLVQATPPSNSSKHSEYLERKYLTVDENLAQLINKVKAFVQTLIQDITSLKLWMCLVLSNETTSTQVNTDSMVDELLHEIETAEREAVGMQDDILAYYVKRNSVITEIFKYPYTHSEHILEAINYKQYIDLKIILGVLRNKYSILHSLILTHWKCCLV
uniref:Proteasome activator complex subunit 3 n=2 Tax=Cacopsylla melanoneura TaxID=428564 RepID=A0A8D8TEK6_9HEMI